jgi:two-component system LytT family response regulator
MKGKKNQASPQRLRAILVDDEPLARVYLSKLLRNHQEIDIVGEAGDLTSAMALISSAQPDVIFLDILMQGRSSLSLLPMLETIDRQQSVVFVTAYDEYAVRAFEANALDYLTKPVSPERLAKTIARMIKREKGIEPQSSGKGNRLVSEDLVLLREGALSMMVKVLEITAIESDADYTRILLADGERKERRVLVKQTLSSWGSQLPSELFCKVSRSLLVNKKSVAKMERKNLLNWELHLEGVKKPIKLSNLESKRLREAL